ncbi:protein FAM219A [Pseudoliparis swirei]|uniref:protein FAM219A n=1 Tax=Pseudoliparis swirei TaxID=2059687 RepID=UPI0024BEC314|nr:protein FAM219A [Pseudoliparis swirei]
MASPSRPTDAAASSTSEAAADTTGQSLAMNYKPSPLQVQIEKQRDLARKGSGKNPVGSPVNQQPKKTARTRLVVPNRGYSSLDQSPDEKPLVALDTDRYGPRAPPEDPSHCCPHLSHCCPHLSHCCPHPSHCCPHPSHCCPHPSHCCPHQTVVPDEPEGSSRSRGHGQNCSGSSASGDSELATAPLGRGVFSVLDERRTFHVSSVVSTGCTAEAER